MIAFEEKDAEVKLKMNLGKAESVLWRPLHAHVTLQ